MNNAKAIPQSIVKTKSIAAVNFTVAFIALSVALPWFAHQFNLAGPKYLPMHFFVLFAGLLLGWRTGLIVGLITPLISFTVSGMPPIAILPQISLEIAVYGLVAGFVREKFGLQLFWSLFIALVCGRAASVIGILLFNSGVPNAFTAVYQATKMGWPGLLIQLALIPLAVYFSKRYFEKHEKPETE